MDKLEPCPFWEKVEMHGADECWLWTGARNAKGYGNYRSRPAHAVAHELAGGTIPDGHEIDHTCRNRSCVNPAHLEAVTHQENVRRAQPTHCRRGHPLEGDNIILKVRSDGVRRQCRICQRRWNLESFHRRTRTPAKHEAK